MHTDFLKFLLKVVFGCPCWRFRRMWSAAAPFFCTLPSSHWVVWVWSLWQPSDDPSAKSASISGKKRKYLHCSALSAVALWTSLWTHWCLLSCVSTKRMALEKNLLLLPSSADLSLDAKTIHWHILIWYNFFHTVQLCYPFSVCVTEGIYLPNSSAR